MSHSRDKGKHEPQKKAAHTLKEKRKMKREKKEHTRHPEEMVAKLGDAAKSHHPPAHN